MNITNLIKNTIGNPSVIMEFGFYDGEDSIKYKQWFPNARVIAIEADENNYVKHSSQMKAKGVETYYGAVSNKNGEVEFYIRKFIKPTNGKPIGFHSPGCGILPVTSYAIEQWSHFQEMDKEKIIVPCFTIEQFCKDTNTPKIDYMHIDVEGALKEVLQGFGSIRPKLIRAETDLGPCYQNSNTKAEYDQMFSEMGYNILKYKEPDTYYLYQGV